VVISLELGEDCLHMLQLMPLHPETPSLASFKSRLVLPFWYWLTKVALEKRPLNWCSSSSSSSSSSSTAATCCSPGLNCFTSVSNTIHTAMRVMQWQIVQTVTEIKSRTVRLHSFVRLGWRCKLCKKCIDLHFNCISAQIPLPQTFKIIL